MYNMCSVSVQIVEIIKLLNIVKNDLQYTILS